MLQLASNQILIQLEKALLAIGRTGLSEEIHLLILLKADFIAFRDVS